MELKTMQAALEAMLFAHAEPLSAERLAELLETDTELVEKLLLAIRDACEEEQRGIQLIQLEGLWQFATKPSQGELVKKVLDTRRNSPLTNAALECLAIIAYNQPVSRAFVDQVRGVDSYTTIAGLVEKGLVAESGRLDLPGRPIAFCTTDAFLRSFGISSLGELPPLHSDAEMEEEAGFYALPAQAAAEEPEMEEEELTRALRGGGFIEAEGGAAALAGEED